MSIESELASFVASTEYDDLPDQVVGAAKKDILDTIGVGLGAASAPGIREVVDYAIEMGGKKSSTILGYGTKVPPANAALANSSMCHALDFDDTHDKAVLHTGSIVVPAALSFAEYIGGVSGKDLISAVTLGEEIHCRLGLATRLWIGWMLTPLYGYFGAATAAGKLLGADGKELRNIWGVAYSLAAGNTEMIASGGLTKRLQAGFAASGGVLAGILAKRGITGAESSFGGKAGIFNLYQRGEYDEKALTDGLGNTFEVMNLSYKPYPCCRFNHSSIDAALEIARRYNIGPADIDEVRVGLSSAGFVNNCEPIEVKRKPRNSVDAQFSTPYCVACALVKKRVGLADFSQESISDPNVLRVSARVYPYVDPDIEKEAGRGIAPSCVEVRTKKGERRSLKVDLPLGHPGNPMKPGEFNDKFRLCARNSKVSPSNMEHLIESVNHLEAMEDIGALMNVFCR